MSQEEIYPSTRPTKLNKLYTYFEDHSWHWLVCKRSGRPSIAEWVNGKWYAANEVGPILAIEMYQRGWRYHSQVVVPKKVREAV